MNYILYDKEIVSLIVKIWQYTFILRKKQWQGKHKTKSFIIKKQQFKNMRKLMSIEIMKNIK